jgi:hypothetical protein
VARSDRQAEAAIGSRADPAGQGRGRNAGVEAAAQTRDELARMVRHVHAAGVPGTALARWCGLNTSRIYEILSTTEAPA